MYTKTNTWKNTLELKEDQFDDFRMRLSSTYDKFRTRVGQLISTIPAEIPGLTVHNLTHLDALWEMADILTDGDYELNPAEAFVLGGAILLHDSAMTIYAYKGRIDELKKTTEYTDAMSYFNSTQNIDSLSTVETSQNSSEKYALSETLRIKHAEKAEELALQQWDIPLNEGVSYLIDDTELREHFGHSIGRIAHSHHWDISQLPKLLSQAKGAFTGFPSEWKVNEVKIALILRCIDAIHIDDRRAPTFESSIREIGEVSMQHWKFQNNLGQPLLDNGKLIFTSKKPFTINEASEWNLCFDTLQMIDKELRDTNDLQQQMNLPLFKAVGVVGAGSANLLSKYIEVDGWKPLPLNLKVSDVPALAKTLGGKDLYNSPITPLREMIQNSADAIEARAMIEDDFELDDGLITTKITKSKSNIIINISDNGIGMSESVLTTALLDFGLSFWKSKSARTEFPGLQQHVEKFRGRYGIGFFSIFMWSSDIQVSSRRFSAGLDEAKTLEFRCGIESRPILRSSSSDEKSTKWTTQIRMTIDSKFLDNVFSKDKDEREYLRSYYSNRMNSSSSMPLTWYERFKLLCGTLPIKVILDSDNKKIQVSLPSWRTCTNKEFYEFFSGVIFERNDNNERFVETLSLSSTPSPLGGRCFISPYKNYTSRLAVYEKGIFINFEKISNLTGVIESNTTNAARDKHSKISIIEDTKLIKELNDKAFLKCEHVGEKIAIQELFFEIGHLALDEPSFILNREIITFNELKQKLNEVCFFSVRLTENHNDVFTWKPADKLSPIVGLKIDKCRVYPLISFEGKLDKNSDIPKAIKEIDSPLCRILKDISELLGPDAKITSDYFDRNGYNNDFIEITISRNQLD